MGDPTGEADRRALRLDFDRRLLLQFRGSAITSDAGLLAYRELDDTLRLTDTGADTPAEARTDKWPDVPLGREPDNAAFLENWAFVSPAVFAHYHA
jgi:hypothetical protein